jgi:hypothetical protein
MPTVAPPFLGEPLSYFRTLRAWAVEGLLLYRTGAGTLSAAQYARKLAFASQGVEFVPAQRAVDHVRLGKLSGTRIHLKM